MTTVPITTEAQHLSLFHREDREAALILVRQENDYRSHKVSSAKDMETIFSKRSEQVDMFFTPNSFYGRRRTRNLAALNAHFVDIDARNGENVWSKVEIALAALTREKIPDPSLIVWTGRGAHLYWFIKRTPPAALPRWRAVQRHLIAVAGADKACSDPTRVLRIAGTINTKNGNRVIGELLSSVRHDFDWFVDQVLPVEREEYRCIRAQPAVKRRKIPSSAQGNGSVYKRWQLVYEDLHKIVLYNWASGHVPRESRTRNNILFHLANSLSWFIHCDYLLNSIKEVARKVIPSFDESLVESYTSTVISRAIETHQTGFEQRYRYGRRQLYEELKHLISDELLPQLRAIIPDALAENRKLESDRKRSDEVRRHRGCMLRTEYEERARSRRILALDLHAQGQCTSSIATQLCVSKRSVQNWIAIVST